ncbi:MAG: hypothetical protein KC563_14680, partial [Nitrospira sp.]|nr:hypothetical protein [Nitrospira sp.]
MQKIAVSNQSKQIPLWYSTISDRSMMILGILTQVERILTNHPLTINDEKHDHRLVPGQPSNRKSLPFPATPTTIFSLNFLYAHASRHLFHLVADRKLSNGMRSLLGTQLYLLSKTFIQHPTDPSNSTA